MMLQMQQAVNAHIYVLTHTHVNNTHVNRYVAQLQNTLQRTRQSAPASNRYTHTLSLCLTHPLSLSHTPSLSHSHSHTHTHPVSSFRVRSLSHYVTRALSLSLSFTNAHTHTQIYTHPHNLPFKHQLAAKCSV